MMFYLLDEKTIRSVVVGSTPLLRCSAGSGGIQVALIPDAHHLQHGWQHEMRGGSRVRGITGEVQ